jgi:hypothetical protein
MTTGPDASTRLAASPVDTILSWMQGRTVTQGWDVVCAIACDKINEWFLEQYVDRILNGENAVITASVPQAGGIAFQAAGLTLGPPLISFSPTLAPGTVALTVNFLSGQVSVTQTGNGVTNILSTQVITPGDDYALTGYVPLASVQGEVDNGHDVVIDVVNGKSFAANLGMPEGAQTLLGQFMQNWLVTNMQGYKYTLGTLVYDDNGTNLKPAGTFQFATQIDANDQADTGRLLLFIPTTYNPGGGAQTALGLADVIPQGCSTALIISSSVLFENILKSFYETTYSNFGVQATASQENPGTAFTLTLTEGTIKLPAQEYDQDKNNGVWTGTLFPKTLDPVSVPLSPVHVQATSNQLQISGTVQWQQHLAKTWLAYGTKSSSLQGVRSAAGTIECQTTASVAAPSDVVSLGGKPSINVSLDLAGWDDDPTFGGWWKNLRDQVAGAALAGLKAFFQVPLPEVNAFAVSNLLFPGKNILDFKSVYVPGDIVLFGDVAAPGVVVSPGSATLAPGQTQQFSATTSSGEAVQWTTKPEQGSTLVGKISASGLYTAPPAVSQVQFNQITATGQQDPKQAAAALVTLVPQGAQISPAFTLITQNSPPQQFSAALSGAPSQQVTWSMEPQIGTLSGAGLYTPPSTVTSPEAVTITATSPSNPSIQGTALIALCAGLPMGIGVTPLQGQPLTPGQAQQFQATTQGKPADVTWSLLPPIGRITANGTYIAPETITAPQSVLVVATSTVFSIVYGTALVTLSPGD